MKKHKIYNKILLIILFGYIIYVLITQQKIINSYSKELIICEENLSKQITYQKSLNEQKENINSKEYIEKVAREKLDMYLPNERVYIDNGK